MYKVKRQGDDDFYFEVVSPNGSAIARSIKNYKSLSDCEKAIKACMRIENIKYDFQFKQAGRKRLKTA